MAATDQAYYTDSANWGEDQYVFLSDIINNFMIVNVGDDKIINKVERHDVIYHAKRGLQQLHFDALKEVRAVEFEMPDTLQMAVPRDFVGLVRVSWVDEKGRLHPMINGNYTTVVGKAFLQDNAGNILYDGTGAALTGTPLMDIRNLQYANYDNTSLDPMTEYVHGARYGMDTANANANGTYNIDKKLGLIRFSSDVAGQLIVLEYTTDGLSNLDDSELKVHKFAEEYIKKYILHEVVNTKFGVQEYIVRRLKKDASSELANTKIRMMNIHPLDIVQTMRGHQKWIK